MHAPLRAAPLGDRCISARADELFVAGPCAALILLLDPDRRLGPWAYWLLPLQFALWALGSFLLLGHAHGGFCTEKLCVRHQRQAELASPTLKLAPFLKRVQALTKNS